MGKSPREAPFDVPGQAVDQIGQAGDENPDVHKHVVDAGSIFVVPGQAVRDLGTIAGDASEAGILLGPDEEETGSNTPDTFEPEGWIAERNRLLAERNFSFTSGETSHLFDELSRRRQRKVLALREKMLALYADRGADMKNIGLIHDNDIDRYLRVHGGSVMGWSQEEYYLIMMGRPLVDRQTGGNSESSTTSIRYHGRKYPVRNFFDLGAETRPTAPRDTIPLIEEGEWLPMVKAVVVDE